MEKNRLINIGNKILKIYLIAFALYFIFYLFVAYSWLVDDGAITDYCIHVLVSSGEYYHFQMNETNACLIDWKPFILNEILFPLVFFLMIFTPAILLRFFLCRFKEK